MKREQFGRPIAGFQITQDRLTQMLSHMTAMQSMISRLSQLQDLGKLSDDQDSLAKIFCTGAAGKSRACPWNSWEGTKQINSLVVGRAITGMSAFT